MLEIGGSKPCIHILSLIWGVQCHVYRYNYAQYLGASDNGVGVAWTSSTILSLCGGLVCSKLNRHSHPTPYAQEGKCIILVRCACSFLHLHGHQEAWMLGPCYNTAVTVVTHPAAITAPFSQLSHSHSLNCHTPIPSTVTNFQKWKHMLLWSWQHWVVLTSKPPNCTCFTGRGTVVFQLKTTVGY